MEPEARKRPHPHEGRDQYTVYDRALISAKMEERTVSFIQADGAEYHDCKILSVDRFAVEVMWLDRKVWIHKGFTTRTEIAE